MQSRQAAKHFINGGLPGGGFHQTIFEQGDQAGGFDADFTNFVTGLLSDDGIADLLVENQKFKNTDSPFVARILAVTAAGTFLKLDVAHIMGTVADALQVTGARLIGSGAVRAYFAQQPLGHDADHR